MIFLLFCSCFSTCEGETIIYHIMFLPILTHFQQVAAEILGQPERGHWKHCLLPEAEEATLCDDFRAAFAPFDFTLG